jgi:RHS repeat-associated protein
MVLDQTGALANMTRHDYLPFGEELSTPTSGRSTGQGYSSGDGVRQQFTQKERDMETGLDYFGARYHSSAQGRFTGGDPANAGADESDPQSWNGYGYTRNSPLVYSDPDGREYIVCDPIGNNCTTVSDEDFWAERRKFKETGNAYTGSGNFFESGEIRNAEGGVVATYAHISIDDPVREAIFAIRNAVDPIPKATLDFFKLSLELGLPNGIIRYVLRAPGTMTTLGNVAGSSQGTVNAALGVVSKPAARQAVERLAASAAAKAAANRAISRATTKSTIDVVQEGTSIIVRITRPGRNGYQVIESVIKSDGTKTVVQKAYDAAGKLVHYDPK